MKKPVLITLIIVGFLVAILAFGAIGYFYFKVTTHNNCVTYSEQVSSQWSQVENVYQRRADLIPNLVNTVKGYANHEKETLEGVVEARSKATSVNIDANQLTPETFAAFQKAQEGLSSALSRLMVVVERYPDLKANQNFLELQAQLEGTENRISVERKKFNDVTRTYNTYIQKFPQYIFVNAATFPVKPYFQAQLGAENAPEVQF